MVFFTYLLSLQWHTIMLLFLILKTYLKVLNYHSTRINILLFQFKVKQNVVAERLRDRICYKVVHKISDKLSGDLLLGALQLEKH